MPRYIVTLSQVTLLPDWPHRSPARSAPRPRSGHIGGIRPQLDLAAHSAGPKGAAALTLLTGSPEQPAIVTRVILQSEARDPEFGKGMRAHQVIGDPVSVETTARTCAALPKSRHLRDIDRDAAA
jgi:hypothetical protein